MFSCLDTFASCAEPIMSRMKVCEQRAQRAFTPLEVWISHSSVSAPKGRHVPSISYVILQLCTRMRGFCRGNTKQWSAKRHTEASHVNQCIYISSYITTCVHLFVCFWLCSCISVMLIDVWISTQAAQMRLQHDITTLHHLFTSSWKHRTQNIRDGSGEVA